MASPKVEPVVKKRSDAYTGLLAISFLAMVGGTVLLALEYQNYEGKKVPDSPKIDVPGAQLKSDPKSGGPPPPKKIEAPVEEVPKEVPKEKDPAMMRRPETVVSIPAPFALPDPVGVSIEQPVSVIQPVSRMADPVVTQIQDLPPPPAAVVEIPIVDIQRLPRPMSRPMLDVAIPDVKPLVPIGEPSLTDEPPPLPSKRFNPNP